MKHILLALFAFTSFLASSQTWKNIGSTAGMNATEVDMEIDQNTGTLFMAYVSTTGTNRIVVRKWQNNAWTNVGVAFGASNATDLKLTILGNGNPAVAYKTVVSTYTTVDTYKFNGTSWSAIGFQDQFSIDANKGITLKSVGTSDLVVSFFNLIGQSFNITNNQLIVLKMNGNMWEMIGSDQELYDVNNYDMSGNVDVTGSALNNLYTAFGEDQSSNFESFRYTTFWAGAGTVAFDNPKNILLKQNLTNTFGAGYTTALVSSKYYLKYKAFNGTAYGAEIRVDSNTTAEISEWDMDGMYGSYIFFYKKGNTAYVKSVSGSTVASLGSGTTVAPTASTTVSFCAETYYSRKVIAYVQSNVIYVKEYDNQASIEDYDLFRMCEGTSFNNDGDPGIYILDDNFEHTNVTMTCQSQNTAVIPQSSVTLSNVGPYSSADGMYFYVTISGTNDVSSNTNVDLLWTLYENGIAVGTIYTPVTVYANPTIAFVNTTNQVCENANPIVLNGKATPVGGTWSGSGVFNNVLVPTVFNPNPSVQTYLVYSKTTAQGCTSKDSVLITINQKPNLVITTDSTDCNAATGSASATITGGQSPYGIYWSNGSTFSSISDLEAGQYYINVTDDNGCMAVGVATVQSTGFTINEQLSHINCNGASTGAIDLSVSGPNGPFTYAWSNGATTQDLTGVAAGAYEVVITDDEECSTTASFTLLQPAALSTTNVITSNSDCGDATGNATVTYTGGQQPYSYLWEDSQGNTLGSTSNTISSIPAGYYFSTVTDNLGCQLEELILISEVNGPVVAIDTITPSDCSANGSITVVNVSNNAAAFEWSNGSTLQDLVGVGTGTYVLTSTGFNGCISVLEGTVPAAQPEFTEICLVTVDTNTNTNLVVWEKPISSTIDHFNIYRETSQAGVYQLAGTVPYLDESIYNDLVASPSVRSWRYKIASVDGCGVESQISENHKTIHLTISEGLGGDYNLAWDSYEGFAYTEFIVWRYTTATGWEQLAQMPINLFTYTDTPTSLNGLEYLVTIESPTTCTTTKAIQDFNTTRSNKDRNAIGGTQGLEEDLNSTISVYPVPSNDEVYVSNTNKFAVNARLLDQTGRVMATYVLKTGVNTINAADLSTGIYNLELSEGEVLINKRIIVQR